MTTPKGVGAAISVRSVFQGNAIAALFVMLGVLFGSWASRIPAMRDGLQLSAAQLGLVLCGGGLGAILAFPFSAWMIARFGARHTVLYAGAVLLLGLVGLAAAPHMAWLMAAMVCFGMCASVFDVAINMVAADAEKAAGRSLMSVLHAWYCAGTFSGAMLGGVMAALSIGPVVHFSGVALLLALRLWVAYQTLPGDGSCRQSEKKHFALPHGALALLGVIGFFAAIAEGSIADWSGIYLKDQLGAGEGVAPLAYAGFAAMMFCTRLAGDRLKDAFGARVVVAAGALLSTTGVMTAVLAANVATAVLGFALSGAGVALTFPFIFSAAGRYGGTALAGVATLGYSGGLIGPPAIGFLSDRFGMQSGLMFIAFLSAVVALMTCRAKILD